MANIVYSTSVIGCLGDTGQEKGVYPNPASELFDQQSV